MNVCMLAYTNYEGDNRVRRYAEALVKRGDRVDVLALFQEGQPRRATIAGVSVYRIQGRRLNEERKIDYMADKLVYLANHADERQRLVKNARELIKTNNWDVKKQEYLRLVDSLVQSATLRISRPVRKNENKTIPATSELPITENGKFDSQNQKSGS